MSVEKLFNRYQWAFIVICSGFFATLYLRGWVWTWTASFTPFLGPSFHDLIPLPAALRALDAGFDPRLGNSYDPLSTAFNYPSIWLHVARILDLNNTNNFYLTSALMVLGVLGVWGSLLGRFPSLLMLLFSLSESTRTLIVSGNIEGFIFILLFGALITRYALITRLAIGLAGLLKVFPLVVFGAVTRDRRGLAQAIGLIGFVLLVVGPELGVIRKATPVSATGFGFKSLVMGAQLYTGMLLPTWVFAAPMIIAPLLLGCLAEDKGPFQKDEITQFFLAGALIYVTAFIFIGSNFGYRLVFLGFCIPYILRQSRLTSTFIGIVLILTANLSIELYMLERIGGALTLVGALILFEWLLYRLTIEFKSWYGSQLFPQRARA